MNRSFFPFFLSLYYRAQKYKHLRRLNSETISSRSLAALDVFEDQLDGNLFLTGDDICYVDLAVLYCLVELREVRIYAFTYLNSNGVFFSSR
jgi:hypothetical protein